MVCIKNERTNKKGIIKKMKITTALKRINSVSFFKHSKFYFLGNIFSKGINILLMPIFTRILSTTDYGIIALYQAFISIAVIVGSLSLDQSIRHVYLKERPIFKEFAGSVLNFVLLFNAIFVVGLFIFDQYIIKAFELKEELFGLAIVNLLFGVGNAIYNMYLMASQESKKFMVLTNEIGLQFSKKSWRAADIAIIEKDKLKDIKRKVNPGTTVKQRMYLSE